MIRKTLQAFAVASLLFGGTAFVRAEATPKPSPHINEVAQRSVDDSSSAEEADEATSERRPTVDRQQADKRPAKKGGRHDWLVKHPTILELLKLQNQERARNGLPPLTLNPEMCLAAQQHAVWMAKTGYYMHSSLPWAEIIFNGPTSPEAAVNGWIWSPAHHSIMLSGSEAGFGYMVIDGRTYWVGVFR